MIAAGVRCAYSQAQCSVRFFHDTPINRIPPEIFATPPDFSFLVCKTKNDAMGRLPALHSRIYHVFLDHGLSGYVEAVPL